jgi:hypothetical protein
MTDSGDCNHGDTKDQSGWLLCVFVLSWFDVARSHPTNDEPPDRDAHAVPSWFGFERNSLKQQ